MKKESQTYSDLIEQTNIHSNSKQKDSKEDVESWSKAFFNMKLWFSWVSNKLNFWNETLLPNSIQKLETELSKYSQKQ